VNAYKPKGKPATEADVSRVAELVAELGEPLAAKKLGLHPLTVARLLARLPVFPSTIKRISERLGPVLEMAGATP
jgi:hypothetical protein